MAFIEEAIISGFVGEAISICTDFSWIKIKGAVKDRKNKHQNIEAQIYNVIVNVLNKITYNKFENDQDKIYQVAEKILVSYKNAKGDSIEAVKCGLQILGESINTDKYMDFKTLLYQEISKSDYEELYRQIRLLQQDEESGKTSRIEQKVDKLQQSADETNRRLAAFQENNSEKANNQNKEPVKSRTQEYADKWNANMFLNDFDEWDENAGVNVKLSDVYIDEHLPHFIYGQNEKEFNNLDVLLSKHIMKTKENKMLLILGQPGIGKSTLITWITVNFANRINDILVYRFASDLGNIDWKNGGISNRVLKELGLNHSDLNGKILILDGFDEVSVEEDRRIVLDNLYGELIYKKNINDFSLIITCRENYIQEFERVKCKYIILQPWNDTQIRSFCNIFQEKTKGEISGNTIEKLIENKEILGIPLILYMVLALNISIEKEGSIVDVYDKIFSLEGGIYDRCIENKMFADKHRIGEIKQQIHQISRDIAIWMFENNSEEASIPQEKYREICDRIIKREKCENREIEQDFLIGNYFKLVKHCEGLETEELYFIHRTIYEFFVSDTIYSSVEAALVNLTLESQKQFACNIVVFLGKNEITYTIEKYISYKIIKLYKRLDGEKQKKFKYWWKRTIDLMVEYGMFYFTNDRITDYKNIISKEVCCFLNLLKISKVLKKISNTKYILGEGDNLERYIKYCVIDTGVGTIDLSYLNLKKIDLKGANLSKAILVEVDFENANLMGVNLSRADLRGTNLSMSNLYKANLGGADLTDVDFERADLREASLEGAKLSGINFSNAYLDDSVWMYEDVSKLMSALKKANFTKIKVVKGLSASEDLYRRELFK